MGGLAAVPDGGPARIGLGARLAQNRRRQRELYGAPLGDRVRFLTGVLGITQARLARALGVSPAMLSQLVSGRRIKIGDPAVLGRLMTLDQLVHGHTGAGREIAPDLAEELLTRAAGTQRHWGVDPSDPRSARPAGGPGGPGGLRGAEDTTAALAALRALSSPARLAAAAAALAPGFPELAEALRRASGTYRP